MTIQARFGQPIAFFFRSLLWSLNLLLVLYTSLAYWLLYQLPTEHWLASMIMITIPVTWLLNVVVMIVWLTARPWRSWLSGLVLLIGFILFGSRTFSVHNPKSPASGQRAIKVLSYNVKTFDLDLASDFEKRESSLHYRRLTNFVVKHDAELKCFQEFWTKRGSPDYDLIKRFREAGYPYSAILHPENVESSGVAFGMGIFSSYPIIQSGLHPFSYTNGIVWADINLPNDTIRLINVHLYSMGIRVGRVLKPGDMKTVKHETRGIFSALRNGFINRSKQLEILEQYIRESPYPVLVTGDFNDTPYSVVYDRVRKLLPNSFENAGHGFGFTYNRLPKFIRIDQQFYDPRLPALDFETITTINDSDHYPILGTYQVK